MTSQSLIFQTIARYSEPWRRFHTMEHLAYLSAMYERVCVQNPAYRAYKEMMEYMIPFHDWVYVPGSKTNEEDSAEFATYWLVNVLGIRVPSGLGYPKVMTSLTPEGSVIETDYQHRPWPKVLAQYTLREMSLSQIPGAILGTKHHENPKDEFEALFFDMDLSGLGSSPEDYARTSKQVRDEFLSNVTPEQFDAGRSEWLVGMLHRPKLFNLPEFQRFDWPARLNMTAELGAIVRSKRG